MVSCQSDLFFLSEIDGKIVVCRIKLKKNEISQVYLPKSWWNYVLTVHVTSWYALFSGTIHACAILIKTFGLDCEFKEIGQNLRKFGSSKRNFNFKFWKRWHLQSCCEYHKLTSEGCHVYDGKTALHWQKKASDKSPKSEKVRKCV